MGGVRLQTLAGNTMRLSVNKVPIHGLAISFCVCYVYMCVCLCVCYCVCRAVSVCVYGAGRLTF